MDGRRRASECVYRNDLPLAWGQGSKREFSSTMLCRSREQRPREVREDPMPVRRRAEVQGEAITYVHGDMPARVGKVKRDLSSLAASVTPVPAGHGRNEDGGG